MEIRIQSVAFAGQLLRARIPFRFGKVTVTEAPLVTARVEISNGHERTVGHSADLAVPKWFEKDARKTAGEDMRELFASTLRAGRAFEGRAGTAFQIWQAAHANTTSLVDGYGLALVERATLDAVCRSAGISFRGALEEDVFGFDPSALLPETAGLRSPALLAPEPPSHVLLRHTVGGLDPLESREVTAELRGEDGHPVALEEDIQRFDLRAYKLKLGGDPAVDLRRLTAIARVVAEHSKPGPLFTLDANEQYANLRELARLLDLLAADPDGRSVLDGLAYIEQPLPREQSFDPASADDVRAISQTAPLLIDEADSSIDAFSRALAIGYRGVSVKNCKGIFRALANRALCLTRGEGAFQTSEDLTNLPVLSLQQDLTTLAALGLPHTERNGHHFFPGLSVVPPAEAEAALVAQPDLYERQDEHIVLKIREGRLSLDCQHATGYGCNSPISWSERSPLDRVAKELPK
ncbi:MAG: hypothetical protein JRH01_02900 [Deltaproteobacteria bacterium]|nr:hypothetical protein [Deltaproteobacteria bacterium]MBW2393807.1 hypothetical protein [Deltaproteobacteria bacterium]